jgi:uncharacterized protein
MKPPYKLILAALCFFMTTACNGQNTQTAMQAADKLPCKAGSKLPSSPAGLSQVQLCISSGKKVHSFTVEIAATIKEQAQGLMFRQSLADDAGMVFPFASPRKASFWMKNTLIPLDIIFIRADGSIESIAENTVPYSETPVASGEPVAAVLELRGGLTKQLGIKSGDIAKW